MNNDTTIQYLKHKREDDLAAVTCDEKKAAYKGAKYLDGWRPGIPQRAAANLLESAGHAKAHITRAMVAIKEEKEVR